MRRYARALLTTRSLGTPSECPDSLALAFAARVDTQFAFSEAPAQ